MTRSSGDALLVAELPAQPIPHQRHGFRKTVVSAMHAARCVVLVDDELFRTGRLRVHPARMRDRNQMVILPVYDQHRAVDLADDPFQGELSQLRLGFFGVMSTVSDRNTASATLCVMNTTVLHDGTQFSGNHAVDEGLVEPAARPQAKRRPMIVSPYIRSLIDRIGPQLLVPVLVCVAWEAAVHVSGVDQRIIPAPSSVLSEIGAKAPLLFAHAIPTVSAVLISFAASAVVGVLLGALLAWSKLLDAAIFPLLIFSQTVPKIAIAPLLMIWFGFGIGSKIVVSFLMAFFAVLMDTMVGIKAMPPELL
jgi:Binding-protein-dependent transport system inner membrane component